MNSVATNRRCVKHHPRITTVMPLSNEQIANLRWLLDYCEFLSISGSAEASYDYANDVAVWHSADPQNMRRWSGSKPEPRHDMELAQEDVDRHGLRYVQGPVFGGGAIGQDESERPYLY